MRVQKFCEIRSKRLAYFLSLCSLFIFFSEKGLLSVRLLCSFLKSIVYISDKIVHVLNMRSCFQQSFIALRPRSSLAALNQILGMSPYAKHSKAQLCAVLTSRTSRTSEMHKMSKFRIPHKIYCERINADLKLLDSIDQLASGRRSNSHTSRSLRVGRRRCMSAGGAGGGHRDVTVAKSSSTWYGCTISVHETCR